ncbi:MAG: carboxypeptidase-like regulatory domain-containing protein [Edaphobacter sp.]|uniref:TonB-dependent receptor n=1 Tax=Edaphobacter sp. TaxID=1934404 RepID=UPI00239E70A1|nr:carboxypeptidase-like regulatory domain-containing protein [Edaphobacter sp.]MDE1177359.1 carboxypeptidase-like regulatory domain-containing protein [Edaphobacter sp.]
MSLASLSDIALAQVEQGRFVGHIQDPTGAIIVGASIEATNVATNIMQHAETNEGGDFVITPVLAGNYTLAVTAQGFQRATTKVIEVQVGQIVRQDLVLPIGTANMTVEVTSTAPLLSTDSATVGTVITNKQVVELPVNGRGFYRLAQLTPGAALLPPTGNSLAIRPEVVNGNVISGIRGSATSFLMDGVDVSEQHQGGTFIQTSIDALQEFSVVQSPYSAEYNRGGAFFNATTKPGTNRYHGVLFEFLRNDALDARNYFSLTRQRQKRNQFGGNLGGPLSVPHLYNGRDRTFFFFNFEGQRLRTGLVNNIIVPSDARRAGNFSDLLGSNRIIYDRTNLVGGVPQPFPGNIIPASRLSPQALAIQQYYPRQNTATGTNSTAPSQSIDFNQYIVRLDHQITPKNRLFARWVYIQQKEVDPNSSVALGNAALTSWGQDIAVGVISNVGSTMVNEARAHFLPSHVRLQGFLQGPDWNGIFGVSGFSDLLRPGVGGVFPDYAWSGYGSLQGSGFDQRPKSQDRKAFEATDNFTILKGKQAIKFGVLFRYYQWLGYDSQNFAGSSTFNGNATGNNTTSGDAYADFLLGYPSAVVRAYPADNFGGQGLYKQFFVQDDYRVSDRLTINMGLRYEYSPWLDGYKGQIGTFDPTQSKPIIVSGTGTVPDLTSQFAAPAAYQYFGQYIQTSSQAGLPLNLTYTNKTQFAPRVGISFGVDRKTVIRAGFGMFYEPEGTGGRVNLNTLPYRLSETINQTQNVTPTRSLANYFLGSPLGSATSTPSLGPTRTHLSMGTNIHYSLNVQRQFTDHDLFEIGYVANRGVHLSSSNDANVPLVPGTGAIQARRPYPLWSGITYQTQDMSNHYDSLQTKFEHRFNRGFSALVAYTYSKTLQYNQASVLGGNTAYEYARAPYDIPHNVAISGSYQLPFGHGRTYLNRTNGFVDALIGGWQAQTILVVRSGTPYTPIISSDRANTGVGSQRPNLNPAGGNPNFKRSLGAWFDRTQYVVAPNFTYGQVRANTLRSGTYNQFDASIFKNFSLPGESTLSFRAELFNFPNTVSFNAPSNVTIDNAAAGQVTSSSNTPRQIQFALKYNF